jgi:signal peptidase I
MAEENVCKEKIASPMFDLWMNSKRQSSISISGNSMRPILTEGSRVLVDHGARHPKTGDIAIYYRDNTLVTHRVILIRKRGNEKFYLTKGDSALRFDKPLIAESDIVGTVKGVVNERRRIDLMKVRWRFFGRVLALCSFIVGTLSRVLFIA